jgi:hypothetical protein
VVVFSLLPSSCNFVGGLQDIVLLFDTVSNLSLKDS